MEHAFNTNIATQYNVNIAVILQNFKFWTFNNLANKRNIHDGFCWTYNTLDAFCLIFPYFSKKQIRTILENAVQEGLIIKGNYNQTKYDRTVWYALSHKAYWYYPELASEAFVDLLFESIDSTNPICPFGHLEKSAWADRFPKTDTPIPDTISNTLSDTKKNNINSTVAAAPKNVNKNLTPPSINNLQKKIKNSLLRELIEVYRKVFPDNPQPHQRVISTSLEKTLLTLIKRWPELDPNGSEINMVVFERYLTGLKTTAPKFALNEYTTEQGTIKKNGLETFARWNTVVKYLEDSYS